MTQKQDLKESKPEENSNASDVQIAAAEKLKEINAELHEAVSDYFKTKRHSSCLQTSSKLDPGIALLAQAITFPPNDVISLLEARIKFLQQKLEEAHVEYWKVWKCDVDRGLVEQGKLFFEAMQQFSNDLAHDTIDTGARVSRSSSVDTGATSPFSNSGKCVTDEMESFAPNAKESDNSNRVIVRDAENSQKTSIKDTSETSSENSETSSLPQKLTSKAGWADITCTCKKTKCLKLYCDCFAARIFCSGNCVCVECRNNEENVELRDQTVQGILKRKPHAFTIYSKAVGKKVEEEELESVQGCNCKKTKCLKKYCICFNGGSFCAPTCRCTMCENVETNLTAVNHHHRKRNKCTDVTPQKPKRLHVEERPESQLNAPFYTPLRLLVTEASRSITT